MELHELIWKRLCENADVTADLTRFGRTPAVFTPEAPPDQAKGWHGTSNYPRIVFAVDLAADEERKCQGNMILSVFAENDGTFDFGKSIAGIKKCLCDVFLTPEGQSPYCLSWNRSDSFSIEGTNICGIEMQFDILEYPCQETTDPDPVDALNQYLKGLYPESLVLWHDRIGQEEAITSSRPVFYCRLEKDSEIMEQSTFAVAWMRCQMAVHVFCTDVTMRRKYARAISTMLAVDEEYEMLDRSPFFVTEAALIPASDYLRAGQIKVSGRYGILRQTEKKKRIGTIHMDYKTGGIEMASNEVHLGVELDGKNAAAQNQEAEILEEAIKEAGLVGEAGSENKKDSRSAGAAEPETAEKSKYSISDLAQAHKVQFGCGRELVEAALRVSGKEEYTLAEAKEIVKKFCKKEVK